MNKDEERLTIDDTFVALKKKLSEATELHYEFEGPCGTSRGEYYVTVLCEYFGACINSEGQVDVHMRILKANGLPQVHDDELIVWIHDRMVEMVCDGSSQINHEDMVIVSTIERGAITYVEDYIDKVELKILDLLKDNDLGAMESAELLNRVLDKIITVMSIENEKDAGKLEQLVIGQYNRELAQHRYDEVEYIR